MEVFLRVGPTPHSTIHQLVGFNHVGQKTNKEDKNLTKTCEECGSNDLKVDTVRGEVVCNHCGLVTDDQASANQSDNAGAMWGEQSYNTPTKDESKIKTGSKGNALGSYIGGKGQVKGKWKQLSQLHAQDAKDQHQMAQKTMDAAKKLGGKDNAMQAKKVISLATVPLDDKKLKQLEEVAEGQEVVLPKNSICRKKTRGCNPEQNAILLALACFKALQDWAGSLNIAWPQMLKGTGISRQQVAAAALVIEKYLLLCEKAGLIEPRVDRKTAMKKVRRLEIENTGLALKKLLDGMDAELKAKVIADYQRRLAKLNEPTIDESPFSSEHLDAKVLCAILFQISCERFGVEQGLLEKIADAVGRCRNTIKNKLKKLLKKVKDGELVDFGVLSPKD